MDKEEPFIMESWTPLSASRQRVGWGKRTWLLSRMGEGSLLKRIYCIHQQHNPADNPGRPEAGKLNSFQDDSPLTLSSKN